MAQRGGRRLDKHVFAQTIECRSVGYILHFDVAQP
jgi:hypothetical protein